MASNTKLILGFVNRITARVSVLTLYHAKLTRIDSYMDTLEASREQW